MEDIKRNQKDWGKTHQENKLGRAPLPRLFSELTEEGVGGGGAAGLPRT